MMHLYYFIVNGEQFTLCSPHKVKQKISKFRDKGHKLVLYYIGPYPQPKSKKEMWDKDAYPGGGYFSDRHL